MHRAGDAAPGCGAHAAEVPPPAAVAGVAAPQAQPAHGHAPSSAAPPEATSRKSRVFVHCPAVSYRRAAQAAEQAAERR
jgi:hypothetical protein